MEDKARRYNDNKPKYSLLDDEFLEEFTKVMTYGYNKLEEITGEKDYPGQIH